MMCRRRMENWKTCSMMKRVDASTAKPVIERVASARANAARVYLELSLELRSVLTLDQWRTLVRKYAEMHKHKNPSETQVTP